MPPRLISSTTYINFFDNVYKQLYTSETNQQQVVIAFSILAIIISLVGVFGLTIFETQYRRKEIGVRKVFGASTRQILWQFNRASLKVAILCSAVAMPCRSRRGYSSWLSR